MRSGYDPAMRTFLALLLTLALASLASAQPNPDADGKAYDACTGAAHDRSQPGKTIELCLAPAKAGIPGAQYILGAALYNRGEAGDATSAVEWLEKSAAAGHPSAQCLLASVLLQEESNASKQRGAALLKSAACAGEPSALEALKQAGATRERIGCTEEPEENFDGEWLADLRWTKSGPVTPPSATYPLKVVVAGARVQVFVQAEGKWIEVKAGAFRIEKHQRTAIVTATDSGWDFDGQWIEVWSLQLLRLGRDDAYAVFTRTVNNPYMPATIPWRAFSSFAEGQAHRSKP